MILRQISLRLNDNTLLMLCPQPAGGTGQSGGAFRSCRLAMPEDVSARWQLCSLLAERGGVGPRRLRTSFCALPCMLTRHAAQLRSRRR